jgi:hypothetical protein
LPKASRRRQRDCVTKTQNGKKFMSETDNWIIKIIHSAYEARLCRNYPCTTCGALEYRSAIVRGAMEAISEDISQYTANRRGQIIEPLFRDLQPEKRQNVIKETASALRGIEDTSGLWGALKLLLMELDDNLIVETVDQTLDALLEGTAVGEMLSSMRTHYANLIAERNKREETERKNAEQKNERSLNNYLSECALAQAKGRQWPQMPNRVSKIIEFKTDEELNNFVTGQKVFQDYLAKHSNRK